MQMISGHAGLTALIEWVEPMTAKSAVVLKNGGAL